MADIWFYTRGGKQMDPVSTNELRQLAAMGNLKPTDMVWKEGMPQWIRASAAREIFDDMPNGMPPQPRSAAARPAVESSRRSSPSNRTSGRLQQDAIPSSAPSYGSRRGMSTGAKVAVVVGVVLLLGGLVTAAILLKINSGGTDVAAAKDKDKDREKDKEDKDKGGEKVDRLVAEFKVDRLAPLREHRKDIGLTAGTKYEITAESEIGSVLTMYVDDEKSAEMAQHRNAPGKAKVIVTARATGRHWVEVFNEADREATITVKVKEVGKGDPGGEVPVVKDKDVVDTFKAFIRDLGDHKHFVELKSGLRYEVTAVNDRGGRMDIYIDDHLSREVAKTLNATGTGRVSFTPGGDGRYRIEIINLGIGDANFNVTVRVAGKGDLPIAKGDLPKGVVDSWKVFIKDLKEDRRMVDLKAGTRYEITARSERGLNLDLYLDDEGGKEMAKQVNAPGLGKLTYTPVVTGRYRVEVINMGIGDSDFTVEVRSLGDDGKVAVGPGPGPGPGKAISTHKAFIRDLGDDKHFVELNAGTRYEVLVTNDRGLRMDVYLDDAGGREVAKQVNALGKATVAYTPAVTGRYRIEVVNMGIGDANFTVEVRADGAGGGGKFDGKFPFTIDTYDVFIRDLGNNIRNYDFEKDTRYEITVSNDRGVNMNLYIVDDLGLDVASDSRPDANCLISWTCTRTGKYKVEVSNQGIGDATAKVTVKAVGRGVGVGGFPMPGKDFGKDKAPDFPKFEFPKAAGLPAGKLVVATKAGARVEDSLGATDIRDPVRFGSYCKVYQVQLTAGKSYTIDMMATFDTYLRLVDSTGVQLASDDDGGEGLNSRLSFRPTATATYRIVATSFGGGSTGNFTLIVRED